MNTYQIASYNNWQCLNPIQIVHSHYYQKYFHKDIQLFVKITAMKNVGFFSVLVRTYQWLSSHPLSQMLRLQLQAKLIIKQSPIYICSFYQPPNASTDPLYALQSNLQLLQQSELSPNIVSGGDFSLPSMKWLINGALLVTSSVYKTEVNVLFLDIVN